MPVPKHALWAVCIVLAASFLAQGQQATPSPTPCVLPPGAPTPTPTPVIYDQRRLAPTVGTGGAVGGPTGLFTIIDGQTLRWKEATFSVAFSNFDRDPGNVDISEVPFSFQTGLTNNIEYFVSQVAYRGVRVNTPQNLSSFYLPNSQLSFGPNQLGSGAAFVLAPFNNRGVTGLLFRPPNNQPFVQYPFVGGPSGNFNITGAPAFAGTLGVQRNGGGRFGHADNFPGIGSIFGSILPGIAPGGTATASNSTQAPSYLPDAPFINRLYGESSLTAVTLGLKIRFPFSTNKTGLGLVPFYRFYNDKADSPRGFNQLQRGASSGGSLGDFGVTFFADHRFHKYLNVSGNVGFTLNSNPRGSANGETFTLLDRPNELSVGVGADVPLRKFLQLIGELRTTRYVGGRTPNGLENSPVDFIGGARFFIKDGIGFGVAYRRHMNQQNGGMFDAAGGFAPSSNANGFIFQFWFGRHFKRTRPPKESRFACLQADAAFELTRACPAGQAPIGGQQCPRCMITTKDDPNPTPCENAAEFDGRTVTLRATGHSPTDDLQELDAVPGEPTPTPTPTPAPVTYVWRTPEGTPAISSTEPVVSWDVSALQIGKDYDVVVETSGELGSSRIIYRIRLGECSCAAAPTPVCRSIVSVSPSDATAEDGDQVTFTAAVTNPPSTQLTYTWDVPGVPPEQVRVGSDGTTVTVDTTGQGGKQLTARVTVGGLDPVCPNNTALGRITVNSVVLPEASCKLFDSYGAITYNDEKARLDNFVIALNENPQLDGYIIAYDGDTLGRNIGTRRAAVRGFAAAGHRIDRAVRYIRENRAYTKRVETVGGGVRGESSVELYVCPANAKRPGPSPVADAGPVGALPKAVPRAARSGRPKALRRHKKRKPVLGS